MLIYLSSYLFKFWLNSIHFNSIQFNGCFLTRRRNSAYYVASTKTQIRHKNNTNTQKQNYKQKQTKQYSKKIYCEKVMGQKP
jgi:hypothetical protein